MPNLTETAIVINGETKLNPAPYQDTLDHIAAALWETGELPATPEKLKIPRGTFRFGFQTIQEARSQGWGLWFTHAALDGNTYAIMAKDNTAQAVSRPMTRADY